MILYRNTLLLALCALSSGCMATGAVSTCGVRCAVELKQARAASTDRPDWYAYLTPEAREAMHASAAYALECGEVATPGAGTVAGNAPRSLCGVTVGQGSLLDVARCKRNAGLPANYCYLLLPEHVRAGVQAADQLAPRYRKTR